MPYCSSCGAQFNSGESFCMKCGKPVDGKSVVSVISHEPSIAQQENNRKASLVEINRMITYFGQKQAQYDEYDDCSEKIAYYSDPRSRVQESGGTGKPFKIFGIIMTAVGGVNTLWSFVGVAALLSSSYSDSAGSAILGLLFFAAILAGGIALLVTGIKKSNNYSQNSKNERARLLSYYEDRYDKLAEELNTHYMNYGYCAVAASYTNPKILTLIREPIYLGRADTIKEAINVMIQDSHNSEMELQASLAAQSAASAARGAKAAAFFSAASFINNVTRR